MRERGWDVWIDDRSLIGGNVDAAIVDGIEMADVVLVCVTCAYCDKVQTCLRNPRRRDACAKEWSYAMARNKLMQPVVMEAEIKRQWPAGVVSAHFGSFLWADGSGDGDDDMEVCSAEVDRMLCRTLQREADLEEMGWRRGGRQLLSPLRGYEDAASPRWSGEGERAARFVDRWRQGILRGKRSRVACDEGREADDAHGSRVVVGTSSTRSLLTRLLRLRKREWALGR